MVSIDVATWTALGTWALVIGTLVLMYWQTRQTQELNSANSILTLRERFDSPRMRAARRELSTHLVRGTHEDITSVEVATFFELVGALTHRKVLKLDLVWEAFGGWVSNYYWALRHPVDLIGRTRTELKDPLVFHEFEWLYHRIGQIDRRMLGATHQASIEAAEESREILKREMTLDVN
ncbi:MAG TPA: hypothetical protein VEY07_00590 [Thermoplasmata archaeon]|nr:hypothetical protein [Thermoplasmata archaeon]